MWCLDSESHFITSWGGERDLLVCVASVIASPGELCPYPPREGELLVTEVFQGFQLCQSKSFGFSHGLV